MAIVLLVPGCWIFAIVCQGRLRRAAVAEIESHGGKVEYGQPYGPASLRKVLGDEYFTEVNSASFDPATADPDLDNLPRLAQLQELSLGFTRITDAGLDRVKGLTQLRKLSLRYTNVTDAGLEQLKGLAGLQSLWLDRTKITDAGLNQLERFTSFDRCCSTTRRLRTSVWST